MSRAPSLFNSEGTMQHRDDSVHMQEVRRCEVAALREELAKRDRLIEQLHLKLGAVEQVLLGYAAVTTSAQKEAAQRAAVVLLDVLRRRATQDDAA